jgi:putative radical SAM enzyme (TIGR03279 family)
MAGGVVAAVAAGSLGAALDISPGDVLLEINGHVLRDVLDVQFYAADEEFELLVRQDGQDVLYEVERDLDIPLGLDFVSPTFDGMRRCDNSCEFCFVAQMPPGLRRSLYVRDDDYRYSVLYGSFVTLTNLTAKDWARLAEQRLSPLYVSVHTTNLDLRKRMLGRTDIPDILAQLDRLADLGIRVHVQVVLIPGVNDGQELVMTLRDLSARYPAVQSIGIVPVGLTRYHRGSCRPYTPSEAVEIIEQVAPFQQAWHQERGLCLVYLADEWYLQASIAVPADDAYDGYPQIENGIGLVRQFLDDCAALSDKSGEANVSRATIVCGTLIAPVMSRAVARITSLLERAMIQVVPVVNRLFGESVTVSGLLGGADVIEALKGYNVGQVVFLPQAMFADSPANEMEAARTLDGLTVRGIADRLSCRVVLADRMSQVWDELTGQRMARSEWPEDV